MFTLIQISSITGKPNSMDIPLAHWEYMEWAESDPMFRPDIQDAFPRLTPEEQEFILTGITAEEWEDIIADDVLLGGRDQSGESPEFWDDETMDDWSDDDYDN